MELADTSTGLHAELRSLAERRKVDAARSLELVERAVYITAAAYAALFAVAVVLYYLNYQEARLDLGNMVQAVWSTVHGHPFQQTTPLGNQASRLGGHVEPMLLLLAPLWLVWSSPLALLVLQALAVASGVLPVFWLARKHLGSARAAGHFAFAYLLFPATQFNAFTMGTGFHAVSLAVPLILYAIWFLDEERLVPFALFAVLAAMTKEEIPLAVGCLGVWYALRKGHRLAGAAIGATGLVWFLVNFLVVIPHFSPSGVDPFAGRYGAIGGTPHGMLHTALTHPTAFLNEMASWHKLVFVVLVLVPFAGLWLFEPLLVLGAVPDLAINLLSSKPEQTSIQFHYTAGIAPFVVAASILGAARLKRDYDRTSFLALVGAACLALYSPLYFAGPSYLEVLRPNAERAAKTQALALIPAHVPVAASNQLAAYLSDRRRIMTFPYVRESNWVVVARDDPTYADAASYRRLIREIGRSTHWRAVFSQHGVEVFRRVPHARR